MSPRKDPIANPANPFQGPLYPAANPARLIQICPYFEVGSNYSLDMKFQIEGGRFDEPSPPPSENWNDACRGRNR
ncbi:6359_t:CDS:2 [Entrophospora sp. SA101]|nr:6359_t:CDS:2 [Entrophospora sp. SA101]CAJ0899684.1 12976_t:CDS:2 [Entrophospora sp. SA101]